MSSARLTVFLVLVLSAASRLLAEVSAEPGITYQWQRYEGSGWRNLVESAEFTGVHTADLSVNNASLRLNDSQFRCLVIKGSLTVPSYTARLNVESARDTLDPDDDDPSSSPSPSTPTPAPVPATPQPVATVTPSYSSGGGGGGGAPSVWFLATLGALGLLRRRR